MEKLLTTEEKQYLRRVCNYLSSLGMEVGEFEFEMDDYGDTLNYNNIDWNQMTHFSNNWRADVPSGLIPILQKITKYASDQELYSSETPDIDAMSWQKFEISINSANKDISFNHYWSWYDRGDASGTEWSEEEGQEIFEEWEKDGVLSDLEIPQDGILTLRYNGSGDSGYIESSFEENGDSVPSTIEDWCYNELEDHFGGWEINEGSDGEFVFDFNNMTITLNHSYNIEETTSDTIYKEDFS